MPAPSTQTYKIFSGEALALIGREMTQAFPFQAIYTFSILSGPNKGLELRLTERELKLNGGTKI